MSTGNAFTTPSISNNTTYYAEASSPEGCISSRTAVLATINDNPTASFNYAGPYCKSDGTAAVSNFSGTSGGTYSSTAGLSLNTTTGTVTLAASSVGTYSVSYNFSNNGCSNTTNATITITGTEGLWLGKTSNDWDNPANWCSNTIPVATTNVVIPTGSINMPSTSSATVIHHLELQAGTILNISGDAFAMSGLLSGTGTISSNLLSSFSISGSSNGSAGILYFTPGNNVVGALTINETGNSGSLSIGSPVTVANVLTATSGTLITNGNLTLASTASNTARVAAINCEVASISGNVTVERYISARRAWRMLGVPVSGSQTIREAWQEGASAATQNPVPGYGTHITGGSTQNGFDQTLTNNPSIRIFNQPQLSFTATPLTSTNLPIDGQPGYLILVRGNRSTDITQAAPPATETILRITGPLKTCTQTVITAQGTCDLVGNPYASAIDFTQFTRTNVPNRFFLWDPYLNTVGGYQTFDASNSFVPTPGGGSYGTAPNSIIQSGQAFFVQGTIGAGSLVITESAKVSGSNSGVFRPADVVSKMSIKLNTVGADASTTLNDGTLAIFGIDYAGAVDNDDARKMINVDEMFSLIRENKLLSIEKRPVVTTEDTLFIKAYNLKVKNYQLVIEPSNFNSLLLTAYLEDNFLNTATIVNLSSTTRVNFTVTSNAASSNSSRFKIIFKAIVVLPVKFIVVKAAKENNHVSLKWTVATEVNVLSYEVETSVDGTNFLTGVNSVQSANSSNNGYYQWIDVKPGDGTIYYRIKAIENSGVFTYSDIVFVKFEKGVPVLTVYPNPFRNNLLVYRINNLPQGIYTLKMLNALGQLAYVERIRHAGGNLMAHLKKNLALADGTYQLVIGNDQLIFSTLVNKN